MTFNFKNKLVVLHSSNTFTKEDLIELMNEAYNLGYKEGYDCGYAAGKVSPSWWTTTNPVITYTDNTYPSSPITITSSNSSNPISIMSDKPSKKDILEFKYNGTER